MLSQTTVPIITRRSLRLSREFELWAAERALSAIHSICLAVVFADAFAGRIDALSGRKRIDVSVSASVTEDDVLNYDHRSRAWSHSENCWKIPELPMLNSSRRIILFPCWLFRRARDTAVTRIYVHDRRWKWHQRGRVASVERISEERYTLATKTGDQPASWSREPRLHLVLLGIKIEISQRNWEKI